MRSFDFVYGVSLIQAHSDHLSKTLQHKSMSAAEGQEIAQLSLKNVTGLTNSTIVSACSAGSVYSVLRFLFHLYHVSTLHLGTSRLTSQKVIFTHQLKTTTGYR